MILMMDTLARFVDNFAKCTYCLMDCREALGYHDRLPLEIFEFYIILLPFYCVIGPLQLRACALPDIDPLRPTDPMPKIFHDFHIRLFARLIINNCDDALAADTLTLQGRQKLRKLEKGYGTHGADAPVANWLIDLKPFMKRDFDFDSAIDHACELVWNSGAFLI
jgi:hypothetical protein